MAKKNSKRPKISFILVLGLILLTGYFIISIVGLRIDIKERREVLKETQQQLKEKEQQNERLQAILDAEDKKSYIEQVARDKLGYVMPGEKVFYDITPGE
ncbi:MAG: septum formation initiator family protein [Clostridiales bacterium]|nr:septum formation initiator family protein [Clostridiales bacterium]